LEIQKTKSKTKSKNHKLQYIKEKSIKSKKGFFDDF